MRLIDADKLEPDIEWSKFYDEFMAYSQRQIRNAEEVKAIPLDKIKKAREKIASSLNGLDEHEYVEKVAKFYIERDLRILDELIESEEKE